MPAKYRKKPVVIEAIQYTGEPQNIVDILEWTKPSAALINDCIVIHTLEGNMRAERSDWVIKGVKNEFYPCKDDIFQATYEPEGE